MARRRRPSPSPTAPTSRSYYTDYTKDTDTYIHADDTAVETYLEEESDSEVEVWEDSKKRDRRSRSRRSRSRSRSRSRKTAGRGYGCGEMRAAAWKSAADGCAFRLAAGGSTDDDEEDYSSSSSDDDDIRDDSGGGRSSDDRRAGGRDQGRGTDRGRSNGHGDARLESSRARGGGRQRAPGSGILPPLRGSSSNNSSNGRGEGGRNARDGRRSRMDASDTGLNTYDDGFAFPNHRGSKKAPLSKRVPPRKKAPPRATAAVGAAANASGQKLFITNDKAIYVPRNIRWSSDTPPLPVPKPGNFVCASLKTELDSGRTSKACVELDARHLRLSQTVSALPAPSYSPRGMRKGGASGKGQQQQKKRSSSSRRQRQRQQPGSVLASIDQYRPSRTAEHRF